LARRLDVSQATISKIETGTQQPTIEFLLRFCATIDLSPEERTLLLGDLATLVTPGTNRREPHFLPYHYLSPAELGQRQRAIATLERRASVIRTYQSAVIPGLLQTQEYIVSIIRLTGLTLPTAIDQIAGTRIKRQASLESKRVEFVVTETALRARVCSSAQAMIEQLRHIQQLCLDEHIALSILPWSTRLSVAPHPSFDVYDDTTVVMEIMHGELEIVDPTSVALYLSTFRTLQQLATSGRDVPRLLDAIMSDYTRLDTLEQNLIPRVR